MFVSMSIIVYSYRFPTSIFESKQVKSFIIFVLNTQYYLYEKNLSLRYVCLFANIIAFFCSFVNEKFQIMFFVLLTLLIINFEIISINQVLLAFLIQLMQINQIQQLSQILLLTSNSTSGQKKEKLEYLACPNYRTIQSTISFTYKNNAFQNDIRFAILLYTYVEQMVLCIFNLFCFFFQRKLQMGAMWLKFCVLVGTIFFYFSLLILFISNV
eukprot:TRINITY_DN9559_c0_g1_i1.p3 TRINITY_DN9559_c0_g1~~TRINITY_DN9559_c0_g1_i1.p3  ORF type:complete len:213 (+),score=-12.77 TRINITY_DN9559_c0_g1_i1:321-959(+)